MEVIASHRKEIMGLFPYWFFDEKLSISNLQTQLNLILLDPTASNPTLIHIKNEINNWLNQVVAKTNPKIIKNQANLQRDNKKDVNRIKINHSNCQSLVYSTNDHKFHAILKLKIQSESKNGISEYDITLPVEISLRTGMIKPDYQAKLWLLKKEEIHTPKATAEIKQVESEYDSIFKSLYIDQAVNLYTQLLEAFNILASDQNIISQGHIFFSTLQNLNKHLTPDEEAIIYKLISKEEIQSLAQKVDKLNFGDSESRNISASFYTLYQMSFIVNKLFQVKRKLLQQNEYKRVDIVNKLIKLLVLRNEQKEIDELKQDNEFKDILNQRSEIGFSSLNEAYVCDLFYCLNILGDVLCRFQKNKGKGEILFELLEPFNYIDLFERETWYKHIYDKFSHFQPNQAEQLLMVYVYHFKYNFSRAYLSRLDQIFPSALPQVRVKVKNEKPLTTKEKQIAILNEVFADCGIKVIYNCTFNNATWAILNTPAMLNKLKYFSQLLKTHSGDIGALMINLESANGLGCKKLVHSECRTIKLNDEYRVSFVINNGQLIILAIEDHTKKKTLEKANRY